MNIVPKPSMLAEVVLGSMPEYRGCVMAKGTPPKKATIKIAGEEAILKLRTGALVSGNL
jgi:hypothetical protein